MEKFGLPGCDRKKIANKYGVTKPIINQSRIKFKTKEVVQALEILRKFGEINFSSDNIYRSLYEFNTLFLKQREEEASKYRNSQIFF